MPWIRKPRYSLGRCGRRAVGGGWLACWGLTGLVRAGKIHKLNGPLELTDGGREVARNLVRSHRLWETYLVEHLGMPLDHVHEPAHRVEHFIDEQMQKEIEAESDTTARDLHGRQIPESSRVSESPSLKREPPAGPLPRRLL